LPCVFELKIEFIRMKKIMSTFLIAALGGFAALGINQYFHHEPSGFDRLTSERLPVQFTSGTTANLANAPDLTSAAEQSVHGVVHVKTLVTNRRGASSDPFYDFFFGNNFGSIFQKGKLS
jgi:hypothetical protein